MLLKPSGFFLLEVVSNTFLRRWTACPSCTRCSGHDVIYIHRYPATKSAGVTVLVLKGSSIYKQSDSKRGSKWSSRKMYDQTLVSRWTPRPAAGRYLSIHVHSLDL